MEESKFTKDQERLPSQDRKEAGSTENEFFLNQNQVGVLNEFLAPQINSLRNLIKSTEQSRFNGKGILGKIEQGIKIVNSDHALKKKYSSELAHLLTALNEAERGDIHKMEKIVLDKLASDMSFGVSRYEDIEPPTERPLAHEIEEARACLEVIGSQVTELDLEENALVYNNGPYLKPFRTLPGVTGTIPTEEEQIEEVKKKGPRYNPKYIPRYNELYMEQVKNNETVVGPEADKVKQPGKLDAVLDKLKII